MKVAAITLRKGNAIDYNGKLMVVTGYEIMQPGKGASVIQIEMRDLRSGNKDNVRFRTQEMIEKLRLEQGEYSFLFEDDDNFTFMNQETYDQLIVRKDILDDTQAKFLTEGMVVQIETFEGEPLSVDLPKLVTVRIETADPVVKGQTASSSYKPAILENGVKVLVPPHVESGTRIVVKTEDVSYVERAKD
jgi:elongation factor P